VSGGVDLICSWWKFSFIDPDSIEAILLYVLFIAFSKNNERCIMGGRTLTDWLTIGKWKNS